MDAIGHEELKQLAYDLGIYLDDEEVTIVLGNISMFCGYYFVIYVGKKEAGRISFDEFYTWWQTEKKFEKLASIQQGEMKESVEYFQQFDS